MTNFIFHEPWWLLGLVAVGGIVTFVFGNRRLDKKLQRVGLSLFALALLFAALRFFFPTTAERMEIRTRQLVASVDARDWNRLQSLLDPATVVGNRSVTFAGGAAAIVAMTRKSAEDFNVHSIRIIGMETTETDSLITVAIEVYSVQDATQGRPDTSSWQLDYEQSGDHWTLDKITLLRLGSQNGNQDFNPSLSP